MRTPALTAKNPSRPVSNRRARQAAQARARRRWKFGAVAVGSAAVLVIVTMLAFGGANNSTGTDFSAEKTSFDLPALSGGSHVRLAEHAGRPVVVNFFASWCVYCNQELPGFVQVAKATQGKVDFIGVDTDDPGDGVAMANRFDLAGAGFSLARDIGPAPASKLWSAFGAQGLPVTAFYDGAGKVVDFSSGMLTQTDLESRLAKDFGVSVQATDASTLAAPVIPLTPQGASELLRTHTNDPAFDTLDVRTPAEYDTGHLAGATNVDFYASDFRDRLTGLDKNRTYLVYCHTGNRSVRATALMHSMGFKHIYDVQGGIAAWQQAGLPITQ